MEKWSVLKEREEEGIIIGDFNIKIRELGSLSELGIERKSKDKMTGNEGRNFLDWIQRKGWYIMNGTTESDWNGEFTYVGARGNTVIDYVIINENV